MTESHIRNVIEAALLAAGKPLQAADLVDLFDEDRPTLAGVQAALAALAEEYSTRGIEIKETAAGFRIQVRQNFSNEISRLWPERPAKYSRALLETLAIIAYRQPITRAEIEAVRGVPVNPNIVKTIVERNWVHVVGHRDVPGRPELLATTRDFLDYFGLKRLDELPPLAEVKALGEIKVQFDLPDPGPLALTSDAAGAPAEAAPGEAPAGENASQESAPEGAAVEVPAVPVSSDKPSTEAAAADTDAPQVAADEAPVSKTPAAETPAVADAPSKGRGSGRKKKRSRSQTSDSALHEAEEFAASVDADLAAGDDDSSDEDELSAAGPDSSELVAGPRDIDD